MATTQNFDMSEEKKIASSVDMRSPETNSAGMGDADEVKRPWWHSVKEPGSALQIVICALVAIGIGMAVVSTVGDIPQAAIDILGIPGGIWLRALKAVVLPLIAVAMIIAVQRLKSMTGAGAKLAKWTVLWYIITTLIAIVHSVLLTSLVYQKQFRVVDKDSLNISAEDKERIDAQATLTISETVVDLFNSFITDNIVQAFAASRLLAVLVVSIVVGWLLKPSSPILRAVYEIEEMTVVVISFLIKCAPIGVFSLILSNLVQLDMESMGINLGLLIGFSLASMLFHLLVLLPAMFFFITKQNPWVYWMKCSPSWITAWGTSSSAATMPVTLKVVAARGVPQTIYKFTVPLGTLINMDGPAVYFPIAVTFLAATQGKTLGAVDYILILVLSTLASIGATPVPSSSLVLIVMISQSVNVPITGMYAVIVAIDWFLDRFRTVLNVSGDLFAARILESITKIEDPPEVPYENAPEVRRGSEAV